MNDTYDDIIGVIKIGTGARVRVTGDDRWVILFVEDGSGAKTTVSLTPSQAFSLAELLKGSGVTAAGVKR